jgi:hypothetical protein
VLALQSIPSDRPGNGAGHGVFENVARESIAPHKVTQAVKLAANYQKSAPVTVTLHDPYSQMDIGQDACLVPDSYHPTMDGLTLTATPVTAQQISIALRETTTPQWVEWLLNGVTPSVFFLARLAASIVISGFSIFYAFSRRSDRLTSNFGSAALGIMLASWIYTNIP